MPAQTITPLPTTLDLNHLRRGAVYRATTAHGSAIGEYLGMEVLYGDHAVLLRNSIGTESIYRDEILAIESIAAA
jgi:hypothetical protein